MNKAPRIAFLILLVLFLLAYVFRQLAWTAHALVYSESQGVQVIACIPQTAMMKGA
jgi:hypothetical protein